MYQEPYRDQDHLPPNIELTTQHTVHRSASKAYSRPPDHQTGWPRWALPLTAVLACVALGIAAAASALLLSYRSATQAQVRQLQAAVTSAQAAAQGRASTSQVDGLAGKVSTIDAAVNALAPFNQVCSQDLTGANGPAQFYFACTDQKP